MAEDWLHDLSGFSAEIVAEACARWRISEIGRPKIADIHKLCVAVQHEEREKREAIEGPQIADYRASRQRREQDQERRNREQAARGREISVQWARDRGYADLAAYERDNGISHEQACMRVINSILGKPKPVAGFKSLAASMGIRVVRQYTPEEMAAARRELGLDEEMQEAAE